MTVIIANDTPPAVRGMLKRWFIEPRPNVFVGTMNARTRDKTLDYIKRNAPDIGLLIIYDDPSSQGFAMDWHGDTRRRPVDFCGLTLVAEQWEEDDTPTIDLDNPDSWPC